MNGSVSGGARVLLRLEGLGLFAASTLIYSHVGQSWGLWFALFLVPDLGMLGYLVGPRIGALTYNATHSLIGPLAMVMLVVVVPISWPLFTAIALIWIAHIGFDRMLGYGLKYVSAFGDTHLGRLGRRTAG
jgi:hypothetical protein